MVPLNSSLPVTALPENNDFQFAARRYIQAVALEGGRLVVILLAVVRRVVVVAIVPMQVHKRGVIVFVFAYIHLYALCIEQKIIKFHLGHGTLKVVEDKLCAILVNIT